MQRGAALRLLREAGKLALALLVTSMVVFLLTRAIPTTPMEAYLTARGLPVTDEAVEALRRQWGLEGSLPEQYVRWVGDLLRGDWGTSTLSGNPIAGELLTRVPLSLVIGFGGLAVAWVLAYPLGMLASLRGGGWVQATRALSVIGQAVPPFAVAVLLINVVGVKLGWVSFYSLTGASAAIAPALLMALFLCGQLARIVCAHADDVRAQPFVRAETGRGFPLSVVLWRHGRRQVLYGMFSASVAKMATVIGGAAILEFVFAVPGMSYYVVNSIEVRDYNVVQAYLMLMALWMVLSHLVFDILLAWLDPRVHSLVEA